jgi:hypothetical protein
VGLRQVDVSSGANDGYYPRFQGDWRQGLSLWTQDYPKADRLFLPGRCGV